MGSRRADSTGPSSVKNSSSPSPSLPPSNDDIEAVIQMATSARPSPDGRGGPVRDTRTQLFVGNLPYRVRWQDLKDLFRKAGTVLRADVSLGPDNRSRGYGTVLLGSAEDACRAVEIFNGYSWQTRILEVRPDRLPPDFDNPSLVGGFTSSVPNLPNALVASPFAHAGQNNPSLSVGTLPPMGEDFVYSSFYVHDGPGLSGTGGKILFVGNLPFHCQWQDLKDLFRQAGTVIRADVALGPDNRSRGFGTVAFATDIDAERAVKMFNGHEYNGRLLKVHHDKYSQATQSMTDSASSTLQSAYYHNTSFFRSQLVNPPNHIPIPIGYHFDVGTHSAPSSPYVSPPNVSMAKQHPSQTHLGSVDHLSASLASTGFNEDASSSNDRQNASQSRPQHHRSTSNHHHAHPGPISLPPPPLVNIFPIPPPLSLSPHAISPLHHPMSPIQHQHPHLMTPHGLPPITPSMPPFSFLPQPSPHGHPASTSSNMQSLNTPPINSAHVISTFSPGVAMSPGAFWGRPGGGVNPFINPAVGAPVHGSPGGFFGMNMHPVSPGAGMDEPTGYFPRVPDTGYFPPMGSSNLANEILRDKSTDGDTPGSISSGATDVGPRNIEHQTSETSWHTSKDEAQASAEDNKYSSSILLNNFTGDDVPDGTQGIIRTSSMSVSGKSADRFPMSRGSSDLIMLASSRDQQTFQDENNECSSAGDADGRAGERWKTEGLVGLGLSVARTDI